MRTFVLSDLHLGNGGTYDIYAGGDALVQFLNGQAHAPARIILNGDTFDFLLNDAPLSLALTVAIEQAQAIAASADTMPVLLALGNVLASGGEVLIRLGNHDIELALQEVQAVFRAGLRQPDVVARRLVFQLGDAPLLLDDMGPRILITHGEQDDVFNRVAYDTLIPAAARSLSDDSGFEYPPGSVLVKHILNPLKHQYQMRFADLLKPDFEGAVLTALTVNPAATHLVFQRSSISLLWMLLRNAGRPVTFHSELESPTDPMIQGLQARLSEAGLTSDEQEAVLSLLESAPPVSFATATEPAQTSADELSPWTTRTSAKLALAGLKLYAQAHRRLAGQEGARFFALDPEEHEWHEAQRLATHFGAQAVVCGHTHAARWKESPGLVYANTGTWIWLMRLPAADAALETWMEFLKHLQSDPALKATTKDGPSLERALHVFSLEPHEHGVQLALNEWRGDRLEVVRTTLLRAS